MVRRLRRAARATPSITAFAVSALALTTSACGPCDGVAQCESSPRVGVGGQIVDREMGGAPVSGVRVDFIRTGGVELDAPTATATTDGNGWWQMSVGARETGFVFGDVVVTPPGGDPPYRLPGQALQATSTRGFGNVFGRWVRRPYISTIGVLADSATNEPIAGARVTAVRRGGVQVEPTVHTESPMVTSGIGYFLYDVRPVAYGPLVVDFVVERAGRPALTIPNVTIVPDHEWGPPRVNGGLIFHIR